MREPRTEMIHVRIGAEDKVAIERAAKRAGMTVSEFMRASTLTVMLTEADAHALKMLAAGFADLVHTLTRRKLTTTGGK